MNRLLLVIILFTIAACATPSPGANRSESVQAPESVQASESVEAMESTDDELLASVDPAENSEGLEALEPPNVGDNPDAMIRQLGPTEPEVVCTRETPTGSRLSVRVCRTLSDIARRQEADQKVFDIIKQRTAVGASRL